MSLNESHVEVAALGWFGELGYAVGHGTQLAPGEPAAERDSFGAVVLVERLREAIRLLNPSIPEEAREEALRKVLRVGTPSLVRTNRAFHRMLRDGVEAEYPRPDGSIAGDRVRLLDFDLPLANDWFVVNQFTVIEGQHNRRPDIVVFVNGLPLGLIELKNAADEGATIWSAYLGKQDDPVPGTSIARWVPSPGLKLVTDKSAWPDLEAYIKDIVGSYQNDKRVVMWDLYNEPGNSGFGNKSQPLVEASFTWARQALPSQPLTISVWGGPKEISDRQIELSVSFELAVL